MTNKDSKYKLKKYSTLRNLIADVAREGKKKKQIHSLFEVDISTCRRLLRERKASGQSILSLTGYITFCFSSALSKHKNISAYRKGKRKIVLFDDVDISTIIEREVDGTKIPMNYIIRKANEKSPEEIEKEMEIAKNSKIGNVILDKKIRTFSRLPLRVRKIIWRYIMRNPLRVKEYLGTAGVTALHVYGRGMSWGMPLSPLTSSITLGGIYEKPVRNDEKEIGFREHLCITATTDHEVVDGAEGMRFLQHFKKMIESGHGLQRD